MTVCSCSFSSEASGSSWFCKIYGSKYYVPTREQLAYILNGGAPSSLPVPNCRPWYSCWSTVVRKCESRTLEKWQVHEHFLFLELIVNKSLFARILYVWISVSYISAVHCSHPQYWMGCYVQRLVGSFWGEISQRGESLCRKKPYNYRL